MTTVDADLTRFRVGESLPAAEQRAHNTSTTSDNKIHDDAVARQYGFRGGLVPGATSYAYLAGYLGRLLGPEWVARGTASIALVRPVYEGEIVRLGGTVTAAEGDAGRGSLALECWVDGADGERRAPAISGLAWGVPPTPEPRPAFADATLTPRLPEERGVITAATAPVGEPLPPVLFDTGPVAMFGYLDAVGDHNPLFREASPFGGALVHPGWWLHAANRVLSGNFILNAWIHTRSEIRHLGPARVGGVYRGYGVITAAFDKRGHEYVTADILLCDDADAPVARVTHTAIVVVARRGRGTLTPARPPEADSLPLSRFRERGLIEVGGVAHQAASEQVIVLRVGKGLIEVGAADGVIGTRCAPLSKRGTAWKRWCSSGCRGGQVNVLP